MYFNLGKTIYLLITLMVFLLFLDFYWFIIQAASTKGAYIKGAFSSAVAVFLVILNYYVLRNYFKPIKDREV